MLFLFLSHCHLSVCLARMWHQQPSEPRKEKILKRGLCYSVSSCFFKENSQIFLSLFTTVCTVLWMESACLHVLHRWSGHALVLWYKSTEWSRQGAAPLVGIPRRGSLYQGLLTVQNWTTQEHEFPTQNISLYLMCLVQHNIQGKIPLEMHINHYYVFGSII